MIKNKLSAMFDDKPVDRAEINRSINLAMQITDASMPPGTLQDSEVWSITYREVLHFLMRYDVES